MTAPIRFFNVDEGLPVDPRLSQRAAIHGLYTGYFKRVLDVVLVLTTAIISVPLIAILAVLVGLDGRSPFFVQQRVGLGGMQFSMAEA